MSSNSLSPTFQIGQMVLSGVFWLVGCIPFVGSVTNIIYEIIRVITFVYIYLPIIRKAATQGIDIGMQTMKIGFVWAICAIMAEIPLIQLLPWDVVSQWYVNRQVKLLLKRVEQLVKNLKKIQQGYTQRGQGQGSVWSQRRALEQDLENEASAEPPDGNNENTSTTKPKPEIEPTLTGDDAFDQLKNKENKNNEEKAKLAQAQKINTTGKISVADQSDNVFKAADAQYDKNRMQSRQMRRDEKEDDQPDNELNDLDEVGSQRPYEAPIQKQNKNFPRLAGKSVDGIKPTNPSAQTKNIEKDEQTSKPDPNKIRREIA